MDSGYAWGGGMQRHGGDGDMRAMGVMHAIGHACGGGMHALGVCIRWWRFGCHGGLVTVLCFRSRFSVTRLSSARPLSRIRPRHTQSSLSAPRCRICLQKRSRVAPRLRGTGLSAHPIRKHPHAICMQAGTQHHPPPSLALTPPHPYTLTRAQVH